MLALRKLTKDDVTISILAIEDDLPVRGNACLSGDEDWDRQVEDEIIERLHKGDAWAWANVEVEIKWQTMRASAYLGACSYLNEQDFIQNSGYYEEMVEETLDTLNKEMARRYETIKLLLVEDVQPTETAR